MQEHQKEHIEKIVEGTTDIISEYDFLNYITSEKKGLFKKVISYEGISLTGFTRILIYRCTDSTISYIAFVDGYEESNKVRIKIEGDREEAINILYDALKKRFPQLKDIILNNSQLNDWPNNI